MGSLRVGVTGGIGAGKSVVCRIFAALGISTYDADSRAKSLMTENLVLVDQIKKKFGGESYIHNVLNRDYLRKEVFNNTEKLAQLNALVHPRVAEDSKKWIAQQKNSPYIIKEAALLFESGSYKELDKIIVVTAPEAIRLNRVLARDSFRSKEDVMSILHHQMPETEKIERADFLITNDEKVLLIPQVLKLHEQFIRYAK